MRFLMAILIGLTSLSLIGCTSKNEGYENGSSARPSQAQSEKAQPATESAGTTAGRLQSTEVSLAQVDAVQASSVAAERKIIRNANLTIEIDSPSEGMRKAAEIAQAHSGFVVTSEFTDNS